MGKKTKEQKKQVEESEQSVPSELDSDVSDEGKLGLDEEGEMEMLQD